MTRTSLSRTVPFLMALALPLAVVAQPQPTTPAAANPADPGPAPTTGRPAARPAHQAEDRVERRISSLHSRLKITPAQESAWQQFAQLMRDNARQMDQTYEDRAQKLATMSAVDNMQSYAKIAADHAQDIQRLVPAFQTLYGQLSPEQQRDADQLFRNFAERRAQGHQRG